LEHLVDISAERAFGNVADLFGAAVAADPTRPLLTYYDDATGERTELSGATLDNWVAKTANLLVDGCGLGTGDRFAVLLPPHWQTAAVLLGGWSAGLELTRGADADVVFAAVDRLDATPAAGDRFVLGLAPMALPLRDVPAGCLDYVAEVRGHGDRFVPAAPARPTDPALDGMTHQELCRAARGAAPTLGPRDRVLVDAAAYTEPLDWLLAPLAAGASIVLCAHLDPAVLPARREAERVTRVGLQPG
jgi:uncharacterized protein (TIGR03089 family)